MLDEKARGALHALLFGIDFYEPQVFPGSLYYPSLRGCVRDVARVHAFLRDRLGLSGQHLRQLVSRQPAVAGDVAPTYENMVAAFDALTREVRSGDRVYIHYSGHGARAATVFRELKSAAGLDEALVPSDIGRPGGQYLRDLELAKLLDRLVERGALVTLVLDACHSGGATRSKGAVARGGGFIDRTPRVHRSLVASEAELCAGDAHRLADIAATQGTRSAELGRSWLPEPRGYVLLAACRPSELAVEFAFDEAGCSGALTYHLLGALSQLQPQLTYRQLHAQLVARIHSQFRTQTPVLEGEADWPIFGSEAVRARPAIEVLSVDENQGTLELAAGQLHGLRKGVRVAIYPAGAALGSAPRQEVAEIIALGASWSTALVPAGAHIEKGAQAVLIDTSTTRLLRRICLEGAAPTWSGLRAVLSASPLQLLREAWPHEDAHYRLRLDETGCYEILDGCGAPLRQMGPAIAPADIDAPTRLLARLHHLCRFHAVQTINNLDFTSPLSGMLSMTLHPAAPDYVPGDPLEVPALDDSRPVYEVEPGRWYFLTIHNQSNIALNFAVLNLQPGWSVQQVYPAHIPFRTMDAGQKELLPLRFELPAGITEGTDILKVLAAAEPVDFRWLELPSIDQPNALPHTRGAMPSTPLGLHLRSVVMCETNESDVPSHLWVTAQIEATLRSGNAA